ncbi:MAG: hypothetical protein U0269_00875 [Polyangiales bacterium]
MNLYRLAAPLCASLLSLTACATTATRAQGTSSGTAEALMRAGPVARDAHAEPLTLVPPSPVAWVKLETARARASRHWPTITALMTNQGTMEVVHRFERELGFDPLNASSRVVGALYRRMQSLDEIPLAAIVVINGFEPERVRAALARDGRIVHEQAFGARAVLSNGQYAVSFLATDVMIAFHPALTERVVRQLSGEEPGTIEADASFDPLWQRAGGRRPGVAQSASNETVATELRTEDGQTVQIPSFRRVVSWVDGDDAVSVRVVAESESAAAASQFVTSVDGIRREYGGRFLVRMMGFGRLLNDGIHLSTDESFVRVAIDAQGGELQRALQFASAGAALSRAN